MGQSQLLLIVVGILIAVLAFVTGAGLLLSEDVEAAKKAIINDMNSIAGSARRYYARPASMVGGNNQFTGYVIPVRFRKNNNGVYSTTVINPKVLQITGKWSRDTTAGITVRIDYLGKASGWTFFGDFE